MTLSEWSVKVCNLAREFWTVMMNEGLGSKISHSCICLQLAENWMKPWHSSLMYANSMPSHLQRSLREYSWWPYLSRILDEAEESCMQIAVRSKGFSRGLIWSLQALVSSKVSELFVFLLHNSGAARMWTFAEGRHELTEFWLFLTT